MSAYLIAEVEVTDAALFEQYRAGVPATIAAYGGKYLVRGGALEALEGTWQPKRVIILQFDSMARLKEWYQSKEYAPLIALRKASAKTNVIAIEGV
jgi:uncharacterized protein (DUF1330 family)